MNYCSKKTKETLAFLAGFAAWIQSELDEPHSDCQPHAKKMKCMLSYVTSIIDDILKDIDNEQRDRIARQIDEHRLALVYKSDNILKKAYAFVDRGVLEKLVNDAWSECFLCEKTGKDEKTCEKRKLLFDAMATPNKPAGGRDCPWRRA